MLSFPQKVRRKKQPYLAIRAMLNKRHISRQAPIFIAEVKTFLVQRGLDGQGPSFSRYLSVDASGDVEMEFGQFTEKVHAGSGPVRTGLLPSGTYISIRWDGALTRREDVAPMLEGWAQARGMVFESQNRAEGTAYSGRMEIYHVAPAADAESSSDTELTYLLAGD